MRSLIIVPNLPIKVTGNLNQSNITAGQTVTFNVGDETVEFTVTRTESLRFGPDIFEVTGYYQKDGKTIRSKLVFTIQQQWKLQTVSPMQATLNRVA